MFVRVTTQSMDFDTHPRAVPVAGTCGRVTVTRPMMLTSLCPRHVSHLRDRLPEVEQYLGLAPGWRFLITPDYEDVWFDESLLNV